MSFTVWCHESRMGNTQVMGKRNSLKIDTKYLRPTFTLPCFGFFLQGSVKATAIINAFVDLTAIVIFSVGLYDFFHFSRAAWNASGQSKKIMRTAFWSSYYLYWVLDVYFSVFLYRTSIRRSYRYCLFWLRIQLTSYVCWLTTFIFQVCYIGWLNATLMAWIWIYALYKPYTFWVIKCFMNELKSLGSLNHTLAKLTDADLEYFENGSRLSNDPEDTPYNHDFELPLKQLNKRSMWIQIGAGEYGKVFKATLTSRWGNHVDVAVKTLNDVEMADIDYFKALLTELKIMIHVGQHENIVNLIGACTTHIQERNLDLIVEFCPYGNLESFLKTRRGLFVNQVAHDGASNRNYCQLSLAPSSPTDAVTTLDLVTWSLQTAKGLEYLHSKKIIHGDVAARNVLLSLDKVAKISDFGLSRKICKYTRNYIKDLTPKLLPWRHLAPECLAATTCRFSYESDVWAFGVTLYEYFSLGDTPYPTWLEYSREFVTEVQKGSIMNRPNYCPSNVYEIMESCWKINPDMRSKLTLMISNLTRILTEFPSIHEQSPEFRVMDSGIDSN